MYRTNQTRGRRSDKTRNLGVLACVALISACATAAPESSGENVGSAQEALLTTACSTTGGNLTLQIKANEVGYVGKVAGCTVEPCVFANALDASGNICRINSTGKTITVTSTGTTGVEKMVVDYANGLFAMATTTPLVTVSLDAGSKLMVIPPVAGGNMALGANGLDANTLLARAATPLIDITMSGVDFLFNGGAGNDVFTGDIAGWTAPAGWNTSAALGTVLGAATTLDLTISGGAGNDTLAGGAGVNSLLGGPGNDIFMQSTTAHAETMNGGDGIDTVDYGARSAPVKVSVGVNAAVATVALGAAGTAYTVGDVLTLASGKVSAATVTVATITGGGATGPVGTVTVTSGGGGYAVASGVVTSGGTGSGATINVVTLSADDGATGEADDVGATVEIIKGGAGDDILTAYAITTTDVVLFGNAGNDQLTGGSGNDDLCGGAGDDKFLSNPGDDNLVGGAGIDTADYSTSTGVVACLNSADTAASKPCAAQNGPTGQKDVVNNVALTKVCPRATLTIDVGGTPTAAQAVPTASQGGAMAVDVENLTGHPTSANSLYCGTLACTLFGGTAADTLFGGASGDAIYGLGGADTVNTKGGNDLVDLTHAGGSVLVTVDCNGTQVTILKAGLDTTAYTNCSFANTP